MQQTTPPAPVDPKPEPAQTSCCVVGAGPAGAILALLLARKGVDVTLLEEHTDFDREFRGDTLHAASMNIMDEIGLARRLLRIPHTKVRFMTVGSGKGAFQLNIGAGFAFWRTKFPYITVLPQVRFLEFVTEEAKRYPNFHLLMGARVDELVEENGTAHGIRYTRQNTRYEIRAALTVAADGRFSRLRKLAALEPIKTSPPIDVLWFRLSRRENDTLDNFAARLTGGTFVLALNRFTYWQVGYVIPKGGYQTLKTQGIEALRQSLVHSVPELADRVNELQEWKQISVLSVESNRLPRWYKPGLMLIGDAAHVMSPVGGVGINYAIGDAVVAFNLLGEKLKSGSPVTEDDLAKVQHQRELPVKFIQTLQTFAQNMVLPRLKKPEQDKDDSLVLPHFMRRFLNTTRFLALPARILGFGLRPPHIRREDRARHASTPTSKASTRPRY
jgi:2-polyprenyl-6-methoxyphenol hydroxylase-like FAD-dependent oxidoreductase